VIDEEGKMLGALSVTDALELARSKSLDLIEVAPNAKPPTCKIMDYGKYKYETKKKLQAAKKKQTVISIKEIQLRPRTDEHDLDVKMKHAKRFLMDGDKVKVNLRFQGREMAHQEVGHKLLVRVTEKLDDVAVVEVPPKMEGRHLFVILAPDAAKIKDYKARLKREGRAEPAPVPAEKSEPEAVEEPEAVAAES